MPIKDFIKKRFELSCKYRWLKMIAREIDKCEKMSKKFKRQHRIVNELVARYAELFGEDLRAPQKRNNRSLYENFEQIKQAQKSHYKEDGNAD